MTARLPGEGDGSPQVGSPADKIVALLGSEDHPPQRPDLPGRDVDVFVSGHTHAPALSRISKDIGGTVVVVNSGCWLRQLRPVTAHLGQPPVYVPEFVLTHARVHLRDSEVHAELWEHPKPTSRSLRAVERLAVLGRLPAQPAADSKPRISASEDLPTDAEPTDGALPRD